MSLEINANAEIRNQIHAGLTRQQAQEAGDEVLSVFDEINTDGNDTISENEYDAFLRTTENEEPETTIENDDITDETEQIDENDNEQAELSSAPRRRKRSYNGELVTNPAITAGYASDRGMLMDAVYEAAYRDVNGIENLNATAGVYTELAVETFNNPKTKVTFGTGVQARVDYRGNASAHNSYGYGASDAKVGYQYVNENWLTMYQQEDGVWQLTDNQTCLETRRNQAVGEVDVHGGFGYCSTRKNRTSDGYAGGYAGIRATYTSDRTTSKVAGYTPEELAHFECNKPSFTNVDPRVQDYEGVYFNPRIGIEAGYAYTNQRGSKFSFDAHAGVMFTSDMQHQYYQDSFQIDKKRPEYPTGTQVDIGVTFTYRPGQFGN